ncbi:hypothetical protein LZ24_02050 [Desulfobotulus alkaliphilus]|uniref:Uncharacterized protein n=1 Tax=Desulfobotulus alkaliphilus TaxID=622671 RepID=A0A562RS94_9BACT|nr:hypothetical protein LZ24_02050 [Desulfobotulus alkaliphilus]
MWMMQEHASEIKIQCNYYGLFRTANTVIAAALYCCKAPWLFARDIAIVSDQSFEGLCERSGKLSEPPQRQRTKACYGNQKAYPVCGGEFLPLPHRARSSRIRLRHGQIAWGLCICLTGGTWKTVLNSNPRRVTALCHKVTFEVTQKKLQFNKTVLCPAKGPIGISVLFHHIFHSVGSLPVPD